MNIFYLTFFINISSLLTVAYGNCTYVRSNALYSEPHDGGGTAREAQSRDGGQTSRLKWEAWRLLRTLLHKGQTTDLQENSCHRFGRAAAKNLQECVGNVEKGQRGFISKSGENLCENVTNLGHKRRAEILGVANRVGVAELETEKQILRLNRQQARHQAE